MFTVKIDDCLFIADPPKVTTNYTRRPDYIDFIFNTAGEPSNHTCLQWIHESELHKQSFKWNTIGKLYAKRTNPSENTGYYICRVSNGIPDLKGKTIQGAKIFFFFSEGTYHIMKTYIATVLLLTAALCRQKGGSYLVALRIF